MSLALRLPLSGVSYCPGSLLNWLSHMPLPKGAPTPWADHLTVSGTHGT